MNNELVAALLKRCTHSVPGVVVTRSVQVSRENRAELGLYLWNTKIAPHLTNRIKENNTYTNEEDWSFRLQLGPVIENVSLFASSKEYRVIPNEYCSSCGNKEWKRIIDLARSWKKLKLSQLIAYETCIFLNHVDHIGSVSNWSDFC